MRQEIIADLRSLLGPDRAIGDSLLPPVAFFAANAAFGLQWAAVRGLAMVPGDQHEKTIRWLADRAGSDLADHCIRTLARRRREMAHA